MAKRIFVSYDYDNDKQWDAGRIKAAISAKMKNANCLLVIVGAKTSTSTWVTWEIQKARELGLSLVAVKISSINTTPAALLGVGATWAMSFTEAAVTKAVANC